jgi:restriction endonuclease Mrr
VECKQYSPQQKVGVEVVRSVYGVQAMHRANKSLIVTTSFFSKPAVEEARIIEPQMELKDYEAIKRWLQRYS